MKKCPVCQEYAEFGKNSSRHDGLQSICKECRASKQKLADRTDILKRYNNSEKGRKTRQKYQSTDKGKIAIKRYRKTDKYHSGTRNYARQYRKNNPERTKAHYKVTDEIRAGRLQSANNFQCRFCNNQAAHYHHDDYSKPLEIIPVCPQCHIDIHKVMAR